MLKKSLIAEGGILEYEPSFLSKDEADTLFTFLKTNVSWEQKFYKNFRTGQLVPQPRLTAWYADDQNMEYSYSGVTQKVLPWIPELLSIKEKIEQQFNTKYNSVLLNYYRSGSDSVGLHADDEKELGKNANIASVSLGAERTFNLVQVKTSDGSLPQGRVSYNLENGSLLVMAGTTQHFWKHEIPKEFGAESRINLTFRWFHKK